MAIGVAIVAISIAGEVRVMVVYLLFILIFGTVAIAGAMMGRRAARKSKS
jgi:hypothetical protein